MTLVYHQIVCNNVVYKIMIFHILCAIFGHTCGSFVSLSSQVTIKKRTSHYLSREWMKKTGSIHPRPEAALIGQPFAAQCTAFPPKTDIPCLWTDSTSG